MYRILFISSISMCLLSQMRSSRYWNRLEQEADILAETLIITRKGTRMTLVEID